MAAGRRPKPTHLKLVTGNPGKRALNKRDAARTGSRPIPPPHLGNAAREAWARVLKMLDGMGVLEATDALALERLCETYAEIVGAQEILRERGSPTYETTTIAGGRMVKTYPEVQVIADADRRFKGYLVEFGLTPAARAKVSAPSGTSKPDTLDGYFGI